MTHAAWKVVVITEKAILDRVAEVVEACGARGWTVVAAGGKGDRGRRSGESPGVADAFVNVKLEAIVLDKATAERIATEVAAAFFGDYAGLTYLEPVEILRPERF